MSEYTLLGGAMIGSLNEKGEWIYKAATSTPFKKNGNLKSIYHDLPRFKVITQYENKEVEDYNISLNQAVRDISLKLLSFSK